MNIHIHVFKYVMLYSCLYEYGSIPLFLKLETVKAFVLNSHINKAMSFKKLLYIGSLRLIQSFDFEFLWTEYPF